MCHQQVIRTINIKYGLSSGGQRINQIPTLVTRWSGQQANAEKQGKIVTTKDTTPPPAHAIVIQQWFDDTPIEPGYYWFFGDPWMGSMGGHYAGTVDPEKRLILVEVHRVSNGLIGIGCGQIIPLRKWDGKHEGYEGRWTLATIPDISNLSK